MKKFVFGNRLAALVLLLLLSLLVFVTCVDREDKNIQEKKDTITNSPEGTVVARKQTFEEFAGSRSCKNCHARVSASHAHTAHFKTSGPASVKNIRGSFKKNENLFSYAQAVIVAMEKTDSGLYQTIYYEGVPKLSLPMDLVVGSGTKGQSFAYWKEHSLYQLPISYFSAPRQWANSPGFPPARILVDRPISLRCMECHSTFMEEEVKPGDRKDQFNPQHIIYGVDCEKCHGPAARHVTYQTQHPKDTPGRFIVNPAKLSRQQNLDLCALCHGGRLQPVQPPFTYVVGTDLSRHYKVDTVSAAAAAAGSFDVHGNQYGLLRASKCFRMSNMTCGTCHNPHENERGRLALFSSRCMECHNREHQSFCTIDPARVTGIEKNCIDCHMPAQPSRAIALFMPGKDAPVASLIRSHFISVYKQATDQFLSRKKQ